MYNYKILILVIFVIITIIHCSDDSLEKTLIGTWIVNKDCYNCKIERDNQINKLQINEIIFKFDNNKKFSLEEYGIYSTEQNDIILKCKHKTIYEGTFEYNDQSIQFKTSVKDVTNYECDEVTMNSNIERFGEIDEISIDYTLNENKLTCSIIVYDDDGKLPLGCEGKTKYDFSRIN